MVRRKQGFDYQCGGETEEKQDMGLVPLYNNGFVRLVCIYTIGYCIHNYLICMIGTLAGSPADIAKVG